jgi:hypothetical protein
MCLGKYNKKANLMLSQLQKQVPSSYCQLSKKEFMEMYFVCTGEEVKWEDSFELSIDYSQNEKAAKELVVMLKGCKLPKYFEDIHV